MNARGQQSGIPPAAATLAVSSLAAVAATIVGLLYAIGALVKTAELRGAGLRPRDAFSLIPLEQHLSRGIQVVVEPQTLGTIALVVFVAALLVVILRAEGAVPTVMERRALDLGDRRELRRRMLGEALSKLGDDFVQALGPVARLARWFGRLMPNQTEEARRRRSTVPLLRLLVLLLLAAAIVRPLEALVLLAAIAVGFLIAVIAVLSPRRTSAVGIVAAFTIGVGTYAVVSALIAPRPLPTAVLSTDKLGVIRGGLIAVTDESWYVTDGRRSFRKISEQRVEWSRVEPGRRASHDFHKTLWELIL